MVLKVLGDISVHAVEKMSGKDWKPLIVDMSHAAKETVSACISYLIHLNGTANECYLPVIFHHSFQKQMPLDSNKLLLLLHFP